MDNLITNLKQFSLYNVNILSKNDDTEVLIDKNVDWLFFNKDSIIELTLGYNIQDYLTNTSLLIAQSDDDGIVFDVNTQKLYYVSLDSLYNAEKCKPIDYTIDDVVNNFSLLDEVY